MEELTPAKKWILLGLYIVAAVITYFLFTSENVLLVKVVIVALLFIFLIFFTFNIGIFKQDVILPSESSEMLRYTMLCRSCGWEWMSQVTKKALAPTRCPNCGDDKLEVLGWRRVKVLNRQNRDLRTFIKGS
jgi:Zn finger protein HypA/HybF involved in hydrogenase expression